MTEPMQRLTFERFQALAEAYGGDVSRWPEEVRDAAALAVAEAPLVTAKILAAAGELDAALDAWRPQLASHALREAIIAAAPRVRRGLGLAGWLTRAGLGAGLAAACAAGVVAGAQVSLLSQAPAGAAAVASALTGYEAIALDGSSSEEAAG
ncbi:hypothetical protein [Phenylobacterium sp.]|uniref:hypothetical protein n=1 Tax=Phenylobacterium sp. TaxID=1871053 RepID=UPI0035AEB40A